MPQVSNEEFVNQLISLFKDAKSQGSVYLGQKRLVQDGPDSVLNATKPPYSIVFRASNGRSRHNKLSKTKSNSRRNFTTIVDSEHIADFWTKYTDALKKGSTGLRKKEKKKAKK